MSDARDGVPGDGPEWDHAFAEKLEGATVLIGITHKKTGEEDRQEQFFGTIMRADASEGVSLRLEGARAGEIVTLPPHLEAFEAADPGVYRLRATGEEVVDPDYTARWTVTAPVH